MRNYEVRVEADGVVNYHDVQLASKELKPSETITGFISLHYKDAEHVHIERVREFVYERCTVCDGTGIIPPCCSGVPNRIECACGGRDTECDQCEKGVSKKYLNGY